jgi:hypothetical protein
MNPIRVGFDQAAIRDAKYRLTGVDRVHNWGHGPYQSPLDRSNGPGTIRLPGSCRDARHSPEGDEAPS